MSSEYLNANATIFSGDFYISGSALFPPSGQVGWEVEGGVNTRQKSSPPVITHNPIVQQPGENRIQAAIRQTQDPNQDPYLSISRLTQEKPELGFILNGGYTEGTLGLPAFIDYSVQVGLRVDTNGVQPQLGLKFAPYAYNGVRVILNDRGLYGLPLQPVPPGQTEYKVPFNVRLGEVTEEQLLP